MKEPGARPPTSDQPASREAPAARDVLEAVRHAPPPELPLADLPWPAATFQTELGGLFYLLNLGLALEFYGDFTQPTAPGIALDVWDFVTLLGRQLLVEERPKDPVWRLLAQFAGRSLTEAPGSGFEPPDTWVLPRGWITPFHEPDTWSWDHASGRLRVLHPAGFLVLDVDHEDGSPEARIHHDTAHLGRSPSLTPAAGTLAPRPAAAVAPLERWLGWVVPYARARLRRALGLGDDAAELAQTLLQHDAHLDVTASHLDIALSLASLPMAVRLSGLDRDPGWLPAAGRHIRFHFE